MAYQEFIGILNSYTHQSIVSLEYQSNFAPLGPQMLGCLGVDNYMRVAYNVAKIDTV